MICISFIRSLWVNYNAYSIKPPESLLLPSSPPQILSSTCIVLRGYSEASISGCLAIPVHLSSHFLDHLEISREVLITKCAKELLYKTCIVLVKELVILKSTLDIALMRPYRGLNSWHSTCLKEVFQRLVRLVYYIECDSNAI